MELTLLAKALAVVGAGLGIAGGGIGLGLVGGRAMEAIARQPSEKKDIRTNMILMAALIEGLAFFGAVVSLLVIFQ
jgi:F-type H+-transporting ATPase subunit c